MNDEIAVQLLAVMVAVACALPGNYLLLRRMALMSDAISHVLLFGIVVAFLLVRDLTSPLLMLGAALSGVLAVALVELLQRVRLVRADAAIGLVFPALFALGVILVTRNTGNVHLDLDSVLLGEIVFAPLYRLEVAGRDLGPRSLWVVGTALVLNVAFIALLYKELKLVSFDATLAASMGFVPVVLHYALMLLVSLTAVASFDAVGPVLVVPLMIVPAATAYLLTDRLGVMLVLSAAIAAVAALIGWRLAMELDGNVAGAMAVVLGLLFALALIAAPKRGLLAKWLRRREQHAEFFRTMLAVHLLNHEATPEEDAESNLAGLHAHFRWTPRAVQRLVRSAERLGWVVPSGERLALTPVGRDVARRCLDGSGMP